mgnify:CR=1 FL=1
MKTIKYWFLNARSVSLPQSMMPALVAAFLATFLAPWTGFALKFNDGWLTNLLVFFFWILEFVNLFWYWFIAYNKVICMILFFEPCWLFNLCLLKLIEFSHVSTVWISPFFPISVLPDALLRVGFTPPRGGGECQYIILTDIY